MWIFLLAGAAVLAIAGAVVAFQLYNQQVHTVQVLQEENDRLSEASEGYTALTNLRASVLEGRREVLDLLEGTGANPRLTQTQIDRGWERVTRACAGPAANDLRCFAADRRAPREMQERSQFWDPMIGDTTRWLQYEVAFLEEAKRQVEAAHATNSPPPPAMICDPVTGRCRRP
jgi:hypothetical protein